MLRMYARCLVEMLTNKEEAQQDDFEQLDIDAELKCILYECYHAKDTTDVKEQERYEQEIARYLQKESEKEGADVQREEFKEQVAKDKESHKEQEAARVDTSTRTIKRKPEVPKANAKNFEEENLRMGVSSVLDLLMGDSKEKQEMAKTKLEGGYIDYSHQQTGNNNESKGKGEPKKKEKVDRYLTI
jgi:hypothetical protein